MSIPKGLHGDIARAISKNRNRSPLEVYVAYMFAGNESWDLVIDALDIADRQNIKLRQAVINLKEKR